MTIKELEERTGMARANIRFYESEGLLSPARQENGYRDYSEEDVKTLEKILDICIENLECYLVKRPLRNVIDRKTGYRI